MTKKDSIIDYLACKAFQFTGWVFRMLPVALGLFIGRRLGDLIYCLDFKHKAVAFANIRAALGREQSIRDLNKLTKRFYRHFGQSLVEVFFMPRVNQRYIEKYVSYSGLEHLKEALKKNKGVILLGVHAGSWELANLICANLGFPFHLFVREQKHPRLDALLNHYRTSKGCRIIQRQNQVRQLIEILQNNEVIGLTADQGGREGALVEFFGKQSAFAAGAVKLALKYDCVILPAYHARLRGAYIKTVIEPPLQLKKSGDLQKDIQDNLQELAHIFEGLIRKYPADYYWPYKIWKYALQRKIMILSDGTVGHLRQAQAAAKIAAEALRQKEISSQIETTEIKFKSKLAKFIFTHASAFSGKYNCQGCLWCLKNFLPEAVYRALTSSRPELIISAGSSLAALNYILSRQGLAKSITIMRPSVLSMRRFDLVIMPLHDHPPKRKNVVVTEGALNLVDEEDLQKQAEKIMSGFGQKGLRQGLYLGVLLGGDTKGFRLEVGTVAEVIKQVKSAAEKLNADILVTTSRRTSKEIEDLVKKEFRDYGRCKLLVIANENNPPETVGGILGLSQLVVTSPESISMVSEAVASRKYVLVFAAAALSKKHSVFLDYFAGQKYIFPSQAFSLAWEIEKIWLAKPSLGVLKDNEKVREAIKRIL